MPSVINPRRRPVAAMALLLAVATVAAPALVAARDLGAQPGASRTAIAPAFDSAGLARAYASAAEMPRLRSLLVQWHGRMVGERYFNGASRSRPANIKSASKSVISALVGVAIANGELSGLEQTLGELLPAETRALEPAKRAITVGDLLTMRAGLQSTSFGGYGAWVASRNWVQNALSRPFVEEPGGPMIYSTGSSHLLSAVLTRATGTSTHRYAERVLARPLGIPLRAWTADPQGIYLGGNEMSMTPREMLAFGTLYLRGGQTPDGQQVIPRAWIDSSWVVRTRSPFNGHGYGYGWWIRETRGRPVYFAWGYGGQFIFVVPELELVVVTTSDPNAARGGAHLRAIHDLLDEEIVPTVGG